MSRYCNCIFLNQNQVISHQFFFHPRKILIVNTLIGNRILSLKYPVFSCFSVSSVSIYSFNLRLKILLDLIKLNNFYSKLRSELLFNAVQKINVQMLHGVRKSMVAEIKLLWIFFVRIFRVIGNTGMQNQGNTRRQDHLFHRESLLKFLEFYGQKRF